MAKLLEVIVTSLDDAIEAQEGGADRLELVRALEVGGLTPGIELVRSVLEAVAIPVRVMLRETPSMSADGKASQLREKAEALASLPIDGLVAGFLRNEAIDQEVLEKIFAAAPSCRVTFHRAFDELPDPLSAIEQLKRWPQIDRILTSGGEGDWPERRERLIGWQSAARPSIRVLVGAGVDANVVSQLAADEELEEMHVGRAARQAEAVDGQVHRELVRRLKSMLR